MMMSKEPFPNPTNQKWKKADSASHPITSQSELKPVNTGRYVATPHAATPQIRERELAAHAAASGYALPTPIIRSGFPI